MKLFIPAFRRQREASPVYRASQGLCSETLAQRTERKEGEGEGERRRKAERANE